MTRIDRRPGDAEVSGEPGDKDRVNPALLQIARETGMGFLVGFHEGRVAVDVVVEAFADDQFGLRNIDVLGDLRAFGALHAMVRPQNLIAVGKLDHLERFLAFMAGRKRNVMRRVPVLRHHHVFEALGDTVDHRNHLLTILDRQTAAGQEAILHVDHDQSARRAGLDLIGGERSAHPPNCYLG